MAESTETDMATANKKARLVLLNNIIGNEYNSSIVRDYAEAYALISGLLNRPVAVKNG